MTGTGPTGPRSPYRYDGVTPSSCPGCGQAVPPSGRRRFCSNACRQRAYRRRHARVPAADLPVRTARSQTVYECASCGERALGEQRCDDCNRFRRKLGPGGFCPHCDEPVTLADLLDS